MQRAVSAARQRRSMRLGSPSLMVQLNIASAAALLSFMTVGALVSDS